MHLVLVDENSAGVCPNQEREDQRACFRQGLGTILTLLVAFQSEGNVGGASGNVRGIQTPGLVSNDICRTRTCGQTPAETHDPKLWPLEALADGRSLPWIR